jgi:hypothetical protein
MRVIRYFLLFVCIFCLQASDFCDSTKLDFNTAEIVRSCLLSKGVDSKSDSFGIDVDKETVLLIYNCKKINTSVVVTNFSSGSYLCKSKKEKEEKQKKLIDLSVLAFKEEIFSSQINKCLNNILLTGVGDNANMALLLGKELQGDIHKMKLGKIRLVLFSPNIVYDKKFLEDVYSKIPQINILYIARKSLLCEKKYFPGVPLEVMFWENCLDCSSDFVPSEEVLGVICNYFNNRLEYIWQGIDNGIFMNMEDAISNIGRVSYTDPSRNGCTRWFLRLLGGY